MGGEDAAVSQEEAVAEATEQIPDLGEVPTEPDRAEAAQAENNGNHRVTYKVGDKEAEIQLPPRLLASFKFRIGALEDDDPRVLGLIKKLLSPEQYEKVMDTMDDAGLYDENGEPNEEANTSFGNLLNDAMASYGLTAGESQASTNS